MYLKTMTCTLAGRGVCARGTYKIKFLSYWLPAPVLTGGIERNRDVTMILFEV